MEHVIRVCAYTTYLQSCVATPSHPRESEGVTTCAIMSTAVRSTCAQYIKMSQSSGSSS